VQVSFMLVILTMSMSRAIHASFHCRSLRLLFCSKRVRLSIWIEFFSKKELLNFSIFCGGIKLSVMGSSVSIVMGDLANKVFIGICNCTWKLS
jgi:hypothetical protein